MQKQKNDRRPSGAEQKPRPNGNFNAQPKVKQVKWRIGQGCPIPITLEQGLDNRSIMVHTATAATSRNVVVHPPIGKTPYGQDEWVFSSQGDIPLLLSRRDNPERARVLERRQLRLFQIAVDRGIFLMIQGKLHYKTKVDVDRASFRKALRESYKKAHPDSEFTEAMVLAEADDDVRQSEREFSELSRDEDITRAIEAEYPDTYETCAGPLGDQKQVPVPNLRGKSTVQVMDYIMRAIHDYGELEQKLQQAVGRIEELENALRGSAEAKANPPTSPQSV